MAESLSKNICSVIFLVFTAFMLFSCIQPVDFDGLIKDDRVRKLMTEGILEGEIDYQTLYEPKLSVNNNPVDKGFTVSLALDANMGLPTQALITVTNASVFSDIKWSINGNPVAAGAVFTINSMNVPVETTGKTQLFIVGQIEGIDVSSYIYIVIVD